MAPKADARPQTAEQVAELLRAALAHARAPLQVPLPAELRPEAPQRPLWIAAATVVGVLAIGAIANSSLNYTTSEATHPSIDRRSHDSTSPPSGLPDTAAINQFAVPAAPELWSAEQVDRLLLNSEQDLQRLRATLEADP